MRRIRTRIGSILLSMVLVLSLLPATALADGTTCTGEPCTHEAAIKNLHYETLTEAISASDSGDTIKLLKDIDNSSGDAAINYSLKAGTTLDGDDHTISGAIGVHIPAAGATVQNVNFKDIHNSENKQSAVYASGLTGTATITGCTFDNADWDAIQITPEASTAQIVITGNVFRHTNATNTQERYVHVENTKTTVTIQRLTITDNQFFATENPSDDDLCSISIWRVVKAEDGNLQLNGNYVEDYTTIDLSSSLEWGDLFPARSQPTVDKDDFSAVVRDNGGTVYQTIQDAVDEGDSYVIMIVDAADQSAAIPAGKKISFFAYGYDIGTLTNNGVLSVLGSDASNKASEIINYGTLTLSGDSATAYNIQNNGTLSITGGATYDLNKITNNGSITITGGTFNADPPSGWLATWHKVTQSGSLYKVSKMKASEAVDAGAVAASKSSSTDGGFYYTTVTQGVNSTEATSTYLLADRAENVVISTPSNGDRNLYANGHSFTGSIVINDGCGSLRLYDKGTAGEFTLTNVTGELLYVGGNTTTANATIQNAQLDTLDVVGKGNCTVEGGQYGTVVLEIYRKNSTTNTPTLSIAGGSFASGTVTVKYSNGDPSKTAPLSDYVAEGYMVVTGTGAYPYQVVAAGDNAAEVAPAAEPEVEVPSDLEGDNKTAAEAVKEALEDSTNLVAGDGLDAAANTQANQNTVTADEGKTALEKEITVAADATVTIVIQPYMDVKIEDVDTTANTLTLDITPMYRTVATTADLSDDDDSIVLSGTGKNAVEISGESGELKISGTVIVTIPLPDAMGSAATNSTAYITHFKSDNGPIYVYEGTVSGSSGSYTLTFENPNGFSKMIVTSKSTVAVIGDKTYGTLQDAINAVADSTASGTIKLVADADGATIPVGANITIDGQGTHSIKGIITCTANGTDTQTTNLTLQNLTMDGDTDGDGTNDAKWAIVSANQSDTSVNGLALTMKNCTVKNYWYKGMYLTNAVALNIDNCEFTNNATHEMNNPNNKGDYTIDLNLMNVEAGALSITNTTFSGKCGNKAVIKVTARGGESDVWTNADVPENTKTSVGSLTISGCTFNQDKNMSNAEVPALNIGTDSKADSGKTPSTEENITFAKNTTGDFPVTIRGNKTAVVVNPAYLTYNTAASGQPADYNLAFGDGTTPAENAVVTVPAGQTAVKAATGDMTVVVQPDIPTTPTTPSYGGSSDDDDSYSVSVPASSSIQGGSITVSPRSADKGDTVTITVKPDDGYVLDELTVTTRAGAQVDLTRKSSTQYTFTMPAGSVVIDVSFVREDSAAAADMAFTDVAESFWAVNEIRWAFEGGYMTGTSATTFNPGGTVNRQQVWMILARMAGASPANMAEAKAWAVENGISDGTNPTGAVTRQQLVALLYRFAAQNGYDTNAKADLSGYPDAASVASYAAEPMAWAVANGIIGGTTQGTLNPAGASNRAQMAVILWRFYQTTAG